ncbi:MAG: cytosine permease [Propionibacteriaceae bacterium]|jgi:NCS1 nucleoside transporter family|nr:cytosine permease [Propionibacteriaceae bacterium]
MSTTQQAAPGEKTSVFAIEENGINVIDESERKGKASSLFWPWFAANVSVFSVSYGAWVLGYGISFWQATLATLLGVMLSFLLVALVSLAGKRGSAPTMVLSRAVFGVKGNGFPGVVSWILLVGWETVLVILATLATATVLERLWPSANDDIVKVIAFVVVILIVVAAGVVGFDLIMKIQTVLTIILGIVTVGYLLLAAPHLDFTAVTQIAPGPWQSVVGATVMLATALGLGWVNSAADYSRYLPRKTSGKAVVWWTTFGSSVAPIILIIFGLLLVGSQVGGAGSELGEAIAADPIGALATILPTWYLIPFILVAVGGLASGAVLDIYSSGLTLLTIGLPVKRWVGSTIDGCIMFIGTIAVVWFAPDFVSPFQAFLAFVGVPISAWVGIFLGDMILRRKDYDDRALYDPKGKYGAVNWIAVGGMALLTVIGWGLTMPAGSIAWLNWLGFLYNVLPLDAGTWGYSGLGVLIAIILGFLVPLLYRGRIRAQER